ncbi:hypothetical protein ACFLZM_07735 [Thermodesulfobacteriota bacterium]
MAAVSLAGCSVTVDDIDAGEIINAAKELYNDQSVSGEERAGISTKANFQAVDITATDDLTVTDDATIGDVLSYGGVEHDWIEGTCSGMTGTADGGVSTSSLFTVINPWGVDTYVPEGGFIISITGATTTVDISCGTTSSATLLADPTENLVNDVSVSTSTSVVIYNTSGTVTTADSGFTDPGTTSEDVITWPSGKYIGCYAVDTPSGGHSGLLSPSSTFACTYKIHSFK